MKSKVMTITYSGEKDDCFHYRVEQWKGKKCLIGWPGGETEDSSYDITDISCLPLWQFHLLYQQLAIHGHLLDLEQTVCKQTPIFADDKWDIAKLVGKIEKE
jgi:hypothetical protein